MTKAQHTPGPWMVESNLMEGGIARIQPGYRGRYCIATVPAGNHKETRQADAALIAAAPDLLAVLQELEESAGYWSEYDVPLGIVERIRAAIAKATGEP